MIAALKVTVRIDFEVNKRLINQRIKIKSPQTKIPNKSFPCSDGLTAISLAEVVQ
jgi:hypothetical protein